MRPHIHDWSTREKTLLDLARLRERFPVVLEPVVSPDGEKVALPAKDGEGKWTLCVNGEPWSEERYDRLWLPRFSPDGRLTALVQNDDAWTLAVDGRSWEQAFEFVWGPRFSPSGGHIAVQVRREGRFGVMVDGRPWGSDFFSCRELAIDDAGNVAATVQVAQLNEADVWTFAKGVWSLAFNDNAWDARFVNVYCPTISPDGRRVAAEVRLGIAEYTVAVDGAPWNERFGCVWEPVFDRQGVLAPVRAGGWGMVRDGLPAWEKKYAQLWKATASPDQSRVAATCATDLGHWTVAVDDQPWGARFDDAVLEPRFSADGRHVAATVKHRGRWTVCADGKPWGEWFDMVFEPVFGGSDGSARVAAKVEREGRYTLAVDGQAWRRRFEVMGEPVLSPDGSQVMVTGLEGTVFTRRVVSVEEVC